LKHQVVKRDGGGSGKVYIQILGSVAKNHNIKEKI